MAKEHKKKAKRPKRTPKPVQAIEQFTEARCEACRGKGFVEKEHGLIQVRCEVCKGKGKVQAPIAG